ncbi:membrane protein [Burkholderia lata]|uniref:Membrane protein n=2 Tax=Burkholderia lata (strain ATCC 17760 / DSM 23089 / LMG 22485 / NCIMB 9086 / R18194 / 383) TaxID=482957 RepID=A0A6P2V252_BURL3|nr:membrane protein [Burkholderia lata]
MIFRHIIVGIAAASAASVASAQSSVTLYGLLDEGINFTSNANGHSGWQMRSGDLAGSRWGMLGNEDLGGGYQAVFRLESGFNVNNGASNGGLFTRQAYVGIKSAEWGQVLLGRQYDPTIDLFSPLTAAGLIMGDVAAHPFDNDNTDYDYGFNNAVKYISPNISGLTTEAMYAFSNQAGGFANNRMYSAAASYKRAGLTAAVAYMRITNPGLTSGALTLGSVFTGAAQQNIDAGVNYDFGKTTVGFAYSHTSVSSPTGNAYLVASATQPPGGAWTNWKFDNFELNLRYHFTPAFWAGAAYTFTRSSLDSTVGTFHPNWSVASLMASYSISKRTSLYLQGSYQHVGGDKTNTDFDRATNYAAGGTSSGPNQAIIRAAIFHTF